MKAERHFHPCDCDECMNAGGGLKLPGMGIVHPDAKPVRRRKHWMLSEYRKFRKSRKKITTIVERAA